MGFNLIDVRSEKLLNKTFKKKERNRREENDIN